MHGVEGNGGGGALVAVVSGIGRGQWSEKTNIATTRSVDFGALNFHTDPRAPPISTILFLVSTL